MFNRILMELYDDYEQNNNNLSLVEFSNKTFSDENVRNLFVGSVLILFSMAGDLSQDTVVLEKIYLQ